MIDAVQLTQQLLRFASVTPDQAGSLDFLETLLTQLGFICHRLPFGEVDNLYARRGVEQPNFCFAGHVDVVPAGNISHWQHPPFAGEIHNNILFGRGVVDMKGAIAAFIAALSQFNNTYGSLSLLLTSDEEGPARNGTLKVIDWLKNRGEVIDACLIGEPTNPTYVGEMVKVGRRGSLNATITVSGTAGHVAYPDQADNPIPKLVRLLHTLVNHKLDTGTPDFNPSHLEVTSIDVGNPTANVIPATAHAKLNIRFNNMHTGSSLQQWLQSVCDSYEATVTVSISGEAFLCQDPQLAQLLATAITKVCGHKPEFSTSGGTSDARFLKNLCPVIEFGLINKTAHHFNEQIITSEIYRLETIYRQILEDYFKV